MFDFYGTTGGYRTYDPGADFARLLIRATKRGFPLKSPLEWVCLMRHREQGKDVGRPEPQKLRNAVFVNTLANEINPLRLPG